MDDGWLGEYVAARGEYLMEHLGCKQVNNGQLATMVLSAVISGCAAPAEHTRTVRPQPAEHARQVRKGAGVDLALGHLAREMDRFHKEVIVYDDWCSGGARFYPSGLMGDVEDLSIDEAWTDNPRSGLTCTKIKYSALGSRGQRWAGIYWLWPDKNWGERAGRDLSGAKKLRFWARADGRASVEFKVGGVNRYPHHNSRFAHEDSFGPVATGWLALGRDWKLYTLDLSRHDLANVIGGFCVTFNRPHTPRGCTIYLDDIAFDLAVPVKPRFIRSYLPASPSTDFAFVNAAHSYDNALAILAFVARGLPDDMERARLICDAFVWAFDHDRDFSDGRCRNAYSCGELTDENGHARLPGWWDAKQGRFLEDAYCTGSHVGNQLWVVISLLSYWDAIGRPTNSPYVTTAIRLAEWVEGECRSNTGPGGYTGGFEGSPGGQEKLTWKSTEHAIDAVAAARWLKRATGDAKWDRMAKHAQAFVDAMVDPDPGSIYTGTKENGTTINRRPIPLDATTWACLALDKPQRYAKAFDLVASRRIARCPKGCPIGGLDFNIEGPGDGVWLEGTAQAALAAYVLGRRQFADELLGELERAQQWSEKVAPGAIHAACHDGVTTGFTKSWGPWVYYRRPSLAATCWFILAELQRNPYDLTASAMANGAPAPSSN